MSKVIVTKSKLDTLASVIGGKSNTEVPLTLDEMITAADSITSGGGTPNLQAKTYTVDSAGTETIEADEGYDGLSEVEVTVPQGNMAVTTESEYYTENNNRKWRFRGKAIIDSRDGDGQEGYIDDFTYLNGNYASYNAIQKNTTITPTTSSQTIGGANYMMEGAVTVSAMPTGTAGTPTATKGAVSSHSISVTPSVTNTTGYITGGTKTGTAVTVSASELDSGTKSITSNGSSQDVVGYASVDVNVPNSYSAGDEGKVVSSGALVSQTAHADVTPTTSDQTIDTTTNNSIKVKGDADLVAGNIKKDVEIFGVTGSYEGGGGGISMDDFATAAEPSGDVVIPNATTIARSVFQYRNNLRSVYSASVTKIEASAFNTNTGIQTIDLPNVTTLNGSAVFAWCTNLVSVSLPKLSASNQTNLFQGDTKLELVDFGFGTDINSNVFATCKKLQTLILRRTGSVCALANVNAFTNTPFRGYNSLTGTVYVPSALISTYKTATNWKTMYDAGTCNFVAIEGSQYA